MISKTSLDSIKALVFLARLTQGEWKGTVDIASTIGAPANYLGKSLRALAAEGLVLSQRGQGGGFALAKSPSKISLFEVIGVLEDVSRLSKCIWGFTECEDSAPCPLHSRWKDIRNLYLNLLRRTTIDDLLSDPTLRFEKTMQPGGPYVS